MESFLKMFILLKYNNWTVDYFVVNETNVPIKGT